MNHSSNTPLNAVLQAISNDGIYLSENDIISSALAYGPFQETIKATEEFVALILGFDGPLFDFKKTSLGTKTGKHHEKWPLFYAFERSRMPPPDFLEPTESLKVLRSAWHEIFPNDVRLSGSIEARVGNTDVREGELINTFVAQCRKDLRSQRYKDRLRERNQSTNNLIARWKRHIERIAKSPYNVHVSRFDLGHQPGEHRAYDLGTTDSQFREFIQGLLDPTDSPSPISYICKREYIHEIGYRTHLVLFSDLATTSPYDIAAHVQRRWRIIAGERGSVIHYAHLPHNYRSWGCGNLASHGPALIEGLRRLLLRDKYLRLAPDKHYGHFGLGSLPKTARGASVTSSSANHLTFVPAWPAPF